MALCLFFFLMIRRPPRSTQSRSSAASDVYKRQIYTFGNEKQKQQYLPRIANVDDWWCQGFSEPGSGSDLASLKTKAERKGDKYIVNGQKNWTTLAQHADMIFCLCRTDPSAKKQSGISFIPVSYTHLTLPTIYSV